MVAGPGDGHRNEHVGVELVVPVVDLAQQDVRIDPSDELAEFHRRDGQTGGCVQSVDSYPADSGDGHPCR